MDYKDENTTNQSHGIEKKRRKPEVGDIFVFQLEQMPDRYFFGRVVNVDARLGGLDGGVILIYLYRTFSFDKNVIPALSISELLVPPIGTNTLAWSRGYFEVVASSINKAEDLLQQHCFLNYRGFYVDEYGNPVLVPVEPIGVYGLSGIGAIDLEVSQALGLPQKVI